MISDLLFVLPSLHTRFTWLTRGYLYKELRSGPYEGCYLRTFVTRSLRWELAKISE